MNKIKIAVFVSGSGTNCENIIRYFQNSPTVDVAIVVSSNPQAGALDKARRLNVPTAIITRAQLLDNPQAAIETVGDCDLIVLAGFLPRVPDCLIEKFPHRIVNIHPSLLPKFGGKGMWGRHVHEAVKAAGETRTGITVHYVSPELDGGELIAQYSAAISPDVDTVDDIAAKVHELEMKYFPAVIEKVAEKVALERGKILREQAGL